MNRPVLPEDASIPSPTGTPQQLFHWPWFPIVFVCNTGGIQLPAQLERCTIYEDKHADMGISSS